MYFKNTKITPPTVVRYM